MSKSLSVMLVAHGFPPRETAGTERHTAALARALRARGHTVHVVAATRAVGRRQYDQLEEPGVVRIVNNIATRSLSDGESDPIIDQIMRGLETRFQPDIVHVHHIQFLSSTMKFQAPTVVTLHDQWAWCASGGLGLRNNQPCDGPKPNDCAPCHAAWRPSPSPTARVLTKTAGMLAPIIAPEKLHQLYQKIPATLRPSPLRGEAHLESNKAASKRNKMTVTWYQSADSRIAPSQHLAQLAMAQGLGPVEVIPHGLDTEWFDNTAPPEARQHFVHLGTIGYHKGTDRVVDAWRKAFGGTGPELRLHGPILDPEAAQGHPTGPVLEPHEVRRTLQQARALVIGSRWAENAPLIILEARASGCPIIAPRVGGIPEIIEDGQDGILYDTEDELVTALQQMVKDPIPTPTPPPQFVHQVEQIESVYRRFKRQKT